MKIDKGVPVPNRRVNSSLYPWRDMEVGDSFAAGIEKHSSLRALVSIRGRALGRKFICRRDGDGVRVWRIA